MKLSILINVAILIVNVQSYSVQKQVKDLTSSDVHSDDTTTVLPSPLSTTQWDGVNQTNHTIVIYPIVEDDGSYQGEIDFELDEYFNEEEVDILESLGVGKKLKNFVKTSKKQVDNQRKGVIHNGKELTVKGIENLLHKIIKLATQDGKIHDILVKILPELLSIIPYETIFRALQESGLLDETLKQILSNPSNREGLIEITKKILPDLIRVLPDLLNSIPYEDIFEALKTSGLAFETIRDLLVDPSNRDGLIIVIKELLPSIIKVLPTILVDIPYKDIFDALTESGLIADTINEILPEIIKLLKELFAPVLMLPPPSLPLIKD